MKSSPKAVLRSIDDAFGAFSIVWTKIEKRAVWIWIAGVVAVTIYFSIR